MMTHYLTRKQFKEEERRMKLLAREGWTKDGPADRNLKSWLRGWRQPGKVPA